MSALQLMRGGGEAAPESDETAAVATEFLLNHPKGELRRSIALAALAVVAVGGADWLAVFHLMSLKFTDAMGQPIGDTAGLVAMSGVTLVAYALIGAAYGRPGRLAKAAAAGLYAVVLVLLGTAIAPAESSNIREVWAGVAGGGGFGASGADDAPPWFVLLCVTALSIAFSLFGIVLLVAKTRLSQLLALWRYRARALAALQRIEAAQTQAEERRRLAGFTAALESPATAAALVQAALRQGLEAYRTGVEAEIAALKDAIADLRTPKAEKQRLAALLADAGACLKSLVQHSKERP